jgi:ArsR family transcriptional regulator
MKTTETILEYREELFKALANLKRLQILDLLCKQGELCVCEITPALESEQSNVSQHLAVLKEAGILGSRRDGTKIMYWIDDPKVCQVIDAADDYIHRVLEKKERALRELIKH